MVFYFHPRGYDPATQDYLLYMGEDKYENEHLIQHALPCDVWFHVDAVSSAHVYMRLPKDLRFTGGRGEGGQNGGGIPPEPLEDACQLVKANSISGNRMNNVGVVFTLASNLKKTGDMDVGQVSFHEPRKVSRVVVERRLNDVVNRLNKTKVEDKKPDLEGKRREYESGVRREAAEEAAVAREAAALEADRRRKEKDLHSYDRLMVSDAMLTGKDLKQKYETAEDYEDDFL